MKLGVVGPSYQQRSLPFDAQRTVNMFPIFDEQGKEPASLLGTPGLELFASAGLGPIRGCFSSANGRAFFISGQDLYEVDSGASCTFRGSLNSNSGVVTIAENTTQLAICDGQYVYIFTYSSNLFAQVSDPDLPSAGTIAYIDGYFIVNQTSSGRFYISALQNGTSWDALDFATAESFPDKLLAVVNGIGQLWLFGERTTEVWTNTGASAFPFEKIAGAVIESGTISPYTAISVDNTVIWVANDIHGSGSVYSARGFSPQRISTEAIEKRIQEATDKLNMRAWVYQFDGHVFYVLTGGGLETSLVYDLTTGLWHERAYLNNGILETHLGSCCMFAFGFHLVGDRTTGKIYKMRIDYYSDAGNEIARERIYTHLSDEDKEIRYNRLVIGMESGVGLQTGQGNDPKITLQLSKDGARTWSDIFETSFGKAGKYKDKAVFRRLGVAEQMTFKIRITDPVKVAITGSYLQ